jgi:hypothetical protein
MRGLRVLGLMPPHRGTVGLAGRDGVAARTVTAHQVTEVSKRIPLPKLRPQPHSQVMDNRIATSSRAVDLSREKGGIGEVSDGYGLHPWRRGRRVA